MSAPSGLAAALALRIGLALTLGAVLRPRMELSSPATALDAYAEAAFLRSSGAASLAGFQGTPLLLPLVRSTAGKLLPAAALGALCDATSAAVIRRLALRTGAAPAHAAAAAQAFLWSPLTVLTCAAGSFAPLYLLATLAAVAWAQSGAALPAGAALAAAAHLAGAHTALFLPPLAMLTAAKSFGLQKPGSSLQQAATVLVASFLIASLALAFFAGWVLAGEPLAHVCAAWPAWLVGSPPLQLWCGGEQAGAAGPMVWLGGGETQGGLPPWSNVSPNLGLQWYLFAQVFPRFRRFFGYCFAAMPAAAAAPLAVRFARRPLCALCVQALALGLLRQHPTWADAALWMALLPLLHQELPLVAARPWLAAALPAALLMNTAAYELWLTLGTGNANFFYGMNLVWAAWQVAALTALLKAAYKAEAAEHDGGSGAAADDRED